MNKNKFYFCASKQNWPRSICVLYFLLCRVTLYLLYFLYRVLLPLQYTGCIGTRVLRCIRLYYISDQSFFLKISVKVFLKDIVASQRPIKNINTLIVAAYFYLQFPALPLESFSIYDPMQQYLTRNTGIPPRVLHFKGNLNFVYLLSRLKLIKCIVLKYWLKYCMRYTMNNNIL